MKYITLKAGNVRKFGDEVKCKTSADVYPVDTRDRIPEFRPTFLIGHVIQESDLRHLEFRRAV